MQGFGIKPFVFLYLATCMFLVNGGTFYRMTTFIEASFKPPIAIIPPGYTINATINLTVINEDLKKELPLKVRICCLDLSITSLVNFPGEEGAFHISKKTNIFKVLLRGHKIGATQMRFYIIKNKTSLEVGVRKRRSGTINPFDKSITGPHHGLSNGRNPSTDDNKAARLMHNLKKSRDKHKANSSETVFYEKQYNNNHKLISSEPSFMSFRLFNKAINLNSSQLLIQSQKTEQLTELQVSIISI